MKESNILTVGEVEHCASKLAIKLSNYFQKALKNEISKFKKKRATHPQIMNILVYAISIAESETASWFSLMVQEPMAALKMINAIQTLSEKVVSEQFVANKALYKNN